MKIFLLGGTGLIGRALTASDEFKDHEAIVLTRRKVKSNPAANPKMITYDPDKPESLIGEMTGAYGIINLAGENIGAKPWTKSQKQKIIKSRIKVTGLVSEVVKNASQKPKFVIQASAVGFYGNRNEERLTESSSKGTGFLPEVVEKWESSLNVEEADTRQVFLRTGLVLSASGGLITRLKIPFLLFTGGNLGSGQQWMPWIHMDDEIRAINFLINNKDASGIYNICSPNPARMNEFMKSLGKVVKRPSWLHIPSGVIKLLLGNFGKELLLTSQQVIPERLLKDGFHFSFTEIGHALSDIMRNE